MIKLEVRAMLLGERIKEQRKRNGMSQEKVAELIGVSRQAVAKWEAGLSAPSTAHLFKLAELFGTSADLLLDPGTKEGDATAEQLYQLFKQEKIRKKEELFKKAKRNILSACGISAGYLVVYFLGRILCGNLEQSSALGWVFGTDGSRLSYLYGWLLHQKLFWIAMLISAVPALWGRYRFSYATLSGFVLGLLLGECLGVYPAGAAYGHGHYGWAIWGGIFLLSIVMGIVLEKISGKVPLFTSKRFWTWCVAFVFGAAAVLLLVLGSIPQPYGD